MNNYIKVRIEGKNVNNYVKWLINNKINIIDMNIKKHSELELIIDYHDYNKLFKYSKTYKIIVIKKYGKLKMIDIIKNNKIIIISIIFSICFLYFLSNIIFSIDIIYNDKDITEKLYQELYKYDIKKYHLKKDYKYLEKVKEKILKDNHDILEWIEIEESGTKYIVRVVERKKETKKEEYQYQSIVSTKDAIILSINAQSGEKVKQVNDYVKKDETIISGILTKPDGDILYTKAKGKVYGEVWYKVEVEYPLYYLEERLTGKNKKNISIHFLNYTVPILPYKKYKQFKTNSKMLYENSLIPFKITKDKLYEVQIIEEIYTWESAINKAKDIAKQKIIQSNNKVDHIKAIQVIDKQITNSKIKTKLFVSVVEDITNIIEVKTVYNKEKIGYNEEKDRR